jgi:hypothetical protein
MGEIIEANFGGPKTEPAPQPEAQPQAADTGEAFLKALLEFYGCKDTGEFDNLARHSLVFLKNIIDSGMQLQAVQPVNSTTGSFLTIIVEPRGFKASFMAPAAAPVEKTEGEAAK